MGDKQHLTHFYSTGRAEVEDELDKVSQNQFNWSATFYQLWAQSTDLNPLGFC